MFISAFSPVKGVRVYGPQVRSLEVLRRDRDKRRQLLSPAGRVRRDLATNGKDPRSRTMGAHNGNHVGNPDVFPIEKLGFSKNIGISIRTCGFKLEKIGISLGFH